MSRSTHPSNAQFQIEYIVSTRCRHLGSKHSRIPPHVHCPYRQKPNYHELQPWANDCQGINVVDLNVVRLCRHVQDVLMEAETVDECVRDGVGNPQEVNRCGNAVITMLVANKW